MTTRAHGPTTVRAPARRPPAARSRAVGEHEDPTRARRTAGVPAAVHETLASPGAPLDPGTRTLMGSRFGHDFSRVRLHCDERAARSADAVNAMAYTVGNDIAFGRGLYQPHTPRGQALLAHELAHVTQHGVRETPSPLTVGRHDSAAERDADARVTHAFSASRTSSGRPAAPSRPEHRPAAEVRRTPRGAVLGGVLGLVGGAVLGGLLGANPLVGAAVGLVAGIVGGDRATTKRRHLTPYEIAYAKEIYADSIDYSKVRITRGSVYSLGSSVTIGNTIHFKAHPDEFIGDTLALTEEGRHTLIHEMGHVWQYQNGGLAYIPLSLLAQFKAYLKTGDRDNAYKYKKVLDGDVPWERWNPEQQASAIEDYNILLRVQKSGLATVEELHHLSLLLPYMELVRRGEGAPGGPR